MKQADDSQIPIPGVPWYCVLCRLAQSSWSAVSGEMFVLFGWPLAPSLLHYIRSGRKRFPAFSAGLVELQHMIMILFAAAFRQPLLVKVAPARWSHPCVACLSRASTPQLLGSPSHRLWVKHSAWCSSQVFCALRPQQSVVTEPLHRKPKTTRSVCDRALKPTRGVSSKRTKKRQVSRHGCVSTTWIDTRLPPWTDVEVCLVPLTVPLAVHTVCKELECWL